jgi:hypothetical protein
MLECLICSTPNVSLNQIAGIAVYSCPRCGNWGLARLTADLTNSLQGKLGDWNNQSVHLRSRLSHLIRRQQRRDVGYVQMPLDGSLETWRLEDPLPMPSEQLDDLVITVGDNQPSSAESARLPADALSAQIGATITRQSPNAGLAWLLGQPTTKSLMEKRGEDGNAILLRLGMEGWLRYDTLKHCRVESRRVLMAMQFNDPELDHVVETCFRPAVKQAGFELRLMTGAPPAGVIDNHLRVALRASRFVIADLTHENRGAYWESGFAEGLGRPVIYTCREKEWREQQTHFDTNHLVTVIWKTEKLDQAAAQLKATIRTTLPAESKMTDD